MNADFHKGFNLGCGVVAAVVFVFVVVPLALLMGLAGCGSFLKARESARANAAAVVVMVTNPPPPSPPPELRPALCPRCRETIFGQPPKCSGCGVKFHWL
jgi:hypothetical protein